MNDKIIHNENIIDKDRLIHSLSVARKMMELEKKYKLEESQLTELFILGYNHNIDPY